MNQLPPHPLTLEQAIACQEGWYALTRTRCQRNNNPGNLEYGHFTIQNGAIGSDGRFAIFASGEDGFKALHNLLMSHEYVSLTIDQAIRRFAPSNENDTNAYIKHVCEWTGYTSQHVLNTFLEA